MGTTGLRPPDMAFGERFRVESRRGRTYELTLLHQDAENNFALVKMPDNRIARIDGERVRWSTCSMLPPVPGSALVVGDEVLLALPGGELRGTLAAHTADGLDVRPSQGGPVRAAYASVLALHLLFRAPDLRRGDAFLVRSRSGNEYRGSVTERLPDDRITVLLATGTVVTMRLDRLDLGTLLVLVHVPLERLQASVRE